MVKPTISKDTSIYMLVGVKARICKLLFDNGIKTVGELLAAGSSGVSKIRGFGKRSLNEICRELAIYDLVEDFVGCEE